MMVPQEAFARSRSVSIETSAPDGTKGVERVHAASTSFAIWAPNSCCANAKSYCACRLTQSCAPVPR